MNQVKPVSSANFREFLDRELTQRNSLNPNYSLRAFARDLGVDSSFLSKLLNGKRSMTARTILTLAPRLSLTDEQVQSFLQGASGRRRRFSLSEESTLPIVPFGPVHEKLDWTHLALLAMFDMEGFRADLPLIARRLNITEEAAKSLLQELTEMDFVEQSEEGIRPKSDTHYTMSSRQQPRAMYIKSQIFSQAALSAAAEQTGHSAMTLAISESRIEEANERIKKFRRELAEFMHGDGGRDCVYHLAISLFPAIKK